MAKATVLRACVLLPVICRGPLPPERKKAFDNPVQVEGLISPAHFQCITGCSTCQQVLLPGVLVQGIGPCSGGLGRTPWCSNIEQTADGPAMPRSQHGRSRSSGRAGCHSANRDLIPTVVDALLYLGLEVCAPPIVLHIHRPDPDCWLAGRTFLTQLMSVWITSGLPAGVHVVSVRMSSDTAAWTDSPEQIRSARANTGQRAVEVPIRNPPTV